MDSVEVKGGQEEVTCCDCASGASGVTKLPDKSKKMGRRASRQLHDILC